MLVMFLRIFERRRPPTVGSKVSRKAGIIEQIHFKISREEPAFL
jgi:hypothetical protein